MVCDQENIKSRGSKLYILLGVHKRIRWHKKSLLLLKAFKNRSFLMASLYLK